MNARLSQKQISELFYRISDLSRSKSELFVKCFFDIIEEELLKGEQVKVKGLGVFKTVNVEARESVNVNTGERILIDGYVKVVFTPEAALKDIINKPFAAFETMVLSDYQAEMISHSVETVETVDIADDSIEEQGYYEDKNEVVNNEQEEPKLETEPEKESVPVVEQETAEPEPELEAETESELESEPSTEPETEVEAEFEAETEVELEQEEPKQETELEPKSEPVVEQETAEPGQELETESEVEIEPEPETEQEEPKQETESEPESVPVVEQEIVETKPELEPESEIETEPELEPEPEPATEPKEITATIGTETAVNEAVNNKKNSAGVKIVITLASVILALLLLVYMLWPVILQQYVKHQYKSARNNVVTEQIITDRSTDSFDEDNSSVNNTETELDETPVQTPQEVQTETEPKPVAVKKESAPTAVVNPIVKQDIKLVEEDEMRDLADITVDDTDNYVIVGLLAEHTLQQDEILTVLSKRYYGTKKLWPYIVKYNNFNDFNKLRPGMKILIPKLENK